LRPLSEKFKGNQSKLKKLKAAQIIITVYE